jgi:adenylate kinase
LDSEALKVVLLGPPGAGKGTQAARVAEYLEVPSVASGDLFRDHQKRDTELGRLARSYMQRGVLVPDEVTIRMVTEWIETEAGDGGFLLDGFPRTLGQAEALDGALSSTSGLDRVLYIRVSDEELVRRLTGRLVCRGCGATFHKVSNPPPADGACGECGGELYEREDDRPEAVGKRLEVYFSETAPLIGYYREAGILREVEGEQSIDEVGRELMEKVGGGS